MTKSSKRMQKIYKKSFLHHKYEIEEAVSFLCENSYVNFIESLDITIVLNLKNKKKNNSVIFGSTVLPHGYEKNVRIAVFTKSEKDIEIAKSFGINLLGMEDLAKRIREGERKFDVVLSSIEGKKIIDRYIYSILNSIGLIPNEKFGTVFTSNIQGSIQKIKQGFIRYKIDKYGIVHVSIGKINLSNDKLKDNIIFFIKSIRKLILMKSINFSFKKIVLSTTMGCGLLLNIKESNY